MGATCLVVGAEAGLTDDLLGALGALRATRVRIDVDSSVESLNAAVAGSYLLLDARRRRRDCAISCLSKTPRFSPTAYCFRSASGVCPAVYELDAAGKRRMRSPEWCGAVGATGEFAGRHAFGSTFKHSAARARSGGMPFSFVKGATETFSPQGRGDRPRAFETTHARETLFFSPSRYSYDPAEF